MLAPPEQADDHQLQVYVETASGGAGAAAKPDLDLLDPGVRPAVEQIITTLRSLEVIGAFSADNSGGL